MHLHKSFRLVAVLATLGFATIALTACNGAASGIAGGATGNGYIRVLDGSPDAGPVDIAIDNNVILSNASYGSLTGYASVNGGTSHIVHIYTAGQDSGNGLYSGSVSDNAGSDYTVVFSGEEHPSYATSANVGFITYQEQPFNTSDSGAALNFHNASPFAAAATGLDETNVQFGYSLNSAPADNNVGTAQPLSGMTDPQVLPGAAANAPITFYAVNNTTVTSTPAQISGQCANNELPCTTPNVSLYLVDGPAASTTPATPPTGISVTAKGAFFGAFDGNGLLTR